MLPRPDLLFLVATVDALPCLSCSHTSYPILVASFPAFALGSSFMERWSFLYNALMLLLTLVNPSSVFIASFPFCLRDPVPALLLLFLMRHLFTLPGVWICESPPVVFSRLYWVVPLGLPIHMECMCGVRGWLTSPHYPLFALQPLSSISFFKTQFSVLCAGYVSSGCLSPIDLSTLTLHGLLQNPCLRTATELQDKTKQR